jgi:hypothetical protein
MNVSSEDELQPHWRSMEKRVLNHRPPRKIEEGNRQPTRMKPPATDEEFWVSAGMYDAVCLCELKRKRCDCDRTASVSRRPV